MDRNTNEQTSERALTIEELDAVAGGTNIITTVVNAVVDGINALLGRGTGVHLQSPALPTKDDGLCPGQRHHARQPACPLQGRPSPLFGNAF